MHKTIMGVMGLLLVGLLSIVPWTEAAPKPQSVLIWCQDSTGVQAPCVGGNQMDYDTTGATSNVGVIGIVIPSASGPVAAGTTTNPFVVTVNNATVAVTQSGSWSLAANQSVNVSQINGVTPLMGAGNTGTGSARVTEATDSQLSAGVGATGDAAATAGSTGSLTAKLRLVTTQLDAIQTAVQLIDNIVSGSGINISQINGSTTQVASNGLNTTGAGLQANAIVGQCDDTSPTALTENQFGHARLNCTTHHQIVEVGAALPAGSNSIGQVTANAGTNLNTSALLTTSAHDAAFGTAGSADSQVRSVQGISGMTPVQVQSNNANVATETTLSSILTALQLIDDDQTGATMHHRVSVGTTEDEHEIKGSAGRLFAINVTNTNAAVRYLRCANQVAASTTPGTTTVWYGMAIPGATTGAGYTATFGPSGVAFSTGLTCWLVTGAAETDVAEVAANEINVNYTYK